MELGIIIIEQHMAELVRILIWQAQNYSDVSFTVSMHACPNHVMIFLVNDWNNVSAFYCSC